MDAHTLRMLLVARSRLVSQRQATANTIRGLLKTFGLVVVKGSKGLFPGRVREQIAGNPALTAIIEPLLAVWYAIRDQVTMLDRQMLARTRNDQVARRLMTIPGVGVVIALERSERIPLDGDTIDYRLRAIAEGNSFSKSADSRRQRVPLGRGRATPRFRCDTLTALIAHGTDAKLRLARIGRPRKEP
jgi:hypothetical protein